jgi:hypothetical protein
VSVRVLILGLDALDAETLDDAIARGLAPTMASLRDEGSHVSLRSVADCFAGAVWPTLYSGQTPGHHNVADHFRLRPGSYDVAPAFVGDGAVIGAQVGAWPPVKTLLFDVPKVPISRRPGDSEIAGWAVHAGRGVAARWPRSLDRVLRRAPSSVLHDGEQESDRDDARWRRSLADRLVENLRRRAAVAEALLAQARWELAWVVEGETHAGGHRLFDAPAELDRVVLEADRWVAALKAAAGPRVALLVVSGHGLQAGRTGRAHLLPWLLRWSGLDEGPPSESGGWFAAREVLGAPARDRLRRALPVAVRHRLRAQLMASSFGAPRWPEMDAFPLPSEDHGYVRLNRCGAARRARGGPLGVALRGLRAPGGPRGPSPTASVPRAVRRPPAGSRRDLERRGAAASPSSLASRGRPRRRVCARPSSGGARGERLPAQQRQRSLSRGRPRRRGADRAHATQA